MSTATRSRRFWLAVGIVLAVGGAVVGAARTLASGYGTGMAGMPGMAGTAGMPGTVGAASPGAPPHRLAGMALTQMPEMLVAVVGVVLVAFVALTAVRPPAVDPDAAPTAAAARGRRLGLLVLTGALLVDVSKTSTLGFVIPGMRAEYGLGATTGSTLAVSGLAGCTGGALLYAALARRTSHRLLYVVATAGFVVTSSCGSMPTFRDNVVMCLLMGFSVGMLAPLAIGAIAALSPGGSAGLVGVSCSVLATAGGFLLAAGTATWLVPLFGWRIMWLIGVPSGLLLMLGARWVPDRVASVVRAATPERALTPAVVAPAVPTARERGARPSALDLAVGGYALVAGVVGFGLTTWLPTLVTLQGLRSTASSEIVLIAAAAMIPFGAVLAGLHHRVGPWRTATALAALVALALSVTTIGGFASEGFVVVGLVAAVFLSTSMGAVFLPVVAAQPGRPPWLLGVVSAVNRLGGLSGPLLLAPVVESPSGVIVAVRLLAGACLGVALVVLVLETTGRTRVLVRVRERAQV